VCTRGRGETLRACLAGLARLGYPRLDLLIVDNAPTDDTTRRVFDACVGDDPRFRYTVEPRPGLSWARNRALAEATGELLAYTDDDVEVDPLWLDALVRGFDRGPRVGCVTGPVCSVAVDGPVQAYVDNRVSWDTSCDPRVLSLAAGGNDPVFPYAPGVFGTGANVAFRAELMRRLGGFDVALGAGTVAAGGEDLDAFVRVVRSGHAIAYEPAALVWHHHRSDRARLERQMFAHGSGRSAFLVKHLLAPGTRGPLLRRVPAGLLRLARITASTTAGLSPADVSSPVRPRALLVRELAGMLAGPVLYLRSRRAARAIGAVPLTPGELPASATSAVPAAAATPGTPAAPGLAA
jgi:GT2 family glycosyltransferase